MNLYQITQTHAFHVYSKLRDAGLSEQQALEQVNKLRAAGCIKD